MQGENERQWKKKVNEKTNDISSIKRVTKSKKFLEVSLCGRAKQRQRNVQKKVYCTCKVAFLLIRPIVVFHRSRCCLRRLSLNDFIVVWTNHKYYRELHFWPWLNLCINLTPFLSGQLQGHYKGFAGGIRCISCLSKQQMVASCGLDKFLRIHHLHSRKLLHKVLLKLCMENSSYEAVMRRPRIDNSTTLT